MMGNAETELANLRMPAKVRPMEQPDSGNSQSSPGYEGGDAPFARKPFVERRRNKRLPPWQQDDVQTAKAARIQPLCYLVNDDAAPAHPLKTPFSAAEQSRFGAHGGVRSYSCQIVSGKSPSVVAKIR